MISEPGAVFVSYRRDDARHVAGRLADRLTEKFGSDQVFMDVETIEPGIDFAAELSRAVGSCTVLIALIGQKWSSIADRHGRRRLDDPEDFVVLEIRTALEREIRVIPVLVDGAAMPERSELPRTIQGFARRSAVRLDHETFRSDLSNLVKAVDSALVASERNGDESAQPEHVGDAPTSRTTAVRSAQSSFNGGAGQSGEEETMPPTVYEGCGDDVIDIKKAPGIGIMIFECQESPDNIIVESDGAEGLLVNEIGSYIGKRLIDVERGSVTSQLTLQASGAWKVTVGDTSLATHACSGDPVTGIGDDVVFLAAASCAARITNGGGSNFIVDVMSIESGDWDTPVNKIGNYQGTVRLNAPALVQVTSDGTWWIRPKT